MSKKSSHEYNAGDNIRLFMSTAHYAHQHFGTFIDSLNDANKANKQPNQIERKANDLVQNISRQDILELLINWIFNHLMACNPTALNLARCQ